MLETLIISDMLPLLGSTFLRFLAYFLWCCRSSFSFLVISFNSAHIAQHHYPLRRSPISFLHSLSVLCLPRFVLSSFRRRRGRRKLRPVWSWRLSQNQWAHLEAKLVVLFSSGTQTHTHRKPPPPLIFSQTLSLTVSHSHFYSHFKAQWLQGFEGLNTVYLQPYWLISFLCTNTHTPPETQACRHICTGCTHHTQGLMTIRFGTKWPLPASRDKFVLCFGVHLCMCWCLPLSLCHFTLIRCPRLRIPVTSRVPWQSLA